MLHFRRRRPPPRPRRRRRPSPRAGWSAPSLRGSSGQPRTLPPRCCSSVQPRGGAALSWNSVQQLGSSAQLSSEQPSFSIPVCLAAGILMAPAEALLLLLLSEQLVVTAGVHGTSHQNQPCGPDEYNADGLCCKLCDAGQQVREHCTSPHTKADCVACANGTFAVHPNGDTSCFPCSSCSKDKEVAQQCSPVRDVRCRCPQGSFEHEDLGSCRPCTNCAGGRVLQQCSATRDAVCGEGSPSSSGTLLAVIISLAVIIVS